LNRIKFAEVKETKKKITFLCCKSNTARS